MNTDTPTPRTNKAFLDGYTFCKEDMMPAVAFASQLERELTAVTEQRDRLAEALQYVVDDLDVEISDRIGSSVKWCSLVTARKALEDIKGGDK
jgi:hypothetical protein